MTFNIIKPQKEATINNSNLVMQSNIEMTDEAYNTIITQGFLNNLDQIMVDIKNGDLSSLEKCYKNIEINGSNEILMHVSNIFTNALFKNLVNYSQEELKKETFENFKVPEVYKEAFENKYDEEEDYDDDVVDQREIHKQKLELLANIKKSKQKDFLYEINELRDKTNEILKNVNIQDISKILINSFNTMKSGQLKMGDKNALLQCVVALQKCAVLKKSLEDFIFIRDGFKQFSPIIVNNVSLQKQLFTGKAIIFPVEYSLITQGKECYVYFSNNTLREDRGLSSLAQMLFEKEDKKGKTILNNKNYDSFAHDFTSLLLMNNYFSMNEGIVIDYKNKNKVLNYDIQNIKNFISEHAKQTMVRDLKKITNPENVELFLISNSQIKTMISNAKKVGGKEFDLSFINNCSKIIANSLSISLYDFVFNDNVFSEIIDKKKLLKNIVNTMLSGNYYHAIEERNKDLDIPKEFMTHIIKMFAEHISYSSVEEVFNEALEDLEKDKNKKKKKEDLFSMIDIEDLNKSLIVELVNSTIREGKILGKLNMTGKDISYISKRKKI